MPAIETTLRDDLTAVVNGALGDSAEALATYDEIPELEGLPEGRLDAYVFPGGRTVVKADRLGRELRITCYVVLQERLPRGPERNNRIDALMGVADEIEQAIVDSTVVPFVEFEDGATGRPPYDLDAMREAGVFRTVLSPVFLTFAEAA